jgi:hypothetical protein
METTPDSNRFRPTPPTILPPLNGDDASIINAEPDLPPLPEPDESSEASTTDVNRPKRDRETYKRPNEADERRGRRSRGFDL